MYIIHVNVCQKYTNVHYIKMYIKTIYETNNTRRIIIILVRQISLQAT